MTIALAMDTTAAVELLREQDYRVLKPFKAHEHDNYGASPCGGHIGVYVDVEATSLDTAKAEIIEFAAARFWFQPDGGIGIMGGMLCSYEQPSEPIPPEITAVTGITNDDVRGAKIDDDKIAAMFAGVDLVCAHNASYDRPILERRFPGVFNRLVFGDSWTDIDWRGHGFACGKLSHLLIEACDEWYEPHRALDDVLVGVHILATARPGGRVALAHLLDAVRTPWFRFRAVGAPYDRKDELKARGYRWDDKDRVWWKDIPEPNVADERVWFVQSGICAPSCRRVLARDRFTDRAGRQEFAR